MPKVAVVILNWNGIHFLEKFLPSVLQSTYTNLVVYVADNGSTDDSIAFLKENFPAVKIIINDQNYGFAGGYNVALPHVEADTDYLVLLNSDVEVAPDWIEPIVDLMEQDNTIAACQPKIRAYHQPTHFEYAGAAGGWIDKYGYVFCRGRFFDICEEDTGQYDDVLPVFWATGAAMFIRPKIFAAFGGFDADYFAHMEEIDLCWRIKRAGYKIMYCPDSVVYHVGGGTLPQGNPRKTYLNFRNNLIMMFKNYTRWELVRIMPIRLILDLVAATKSLVTGNAKDCKAILQAQYYFLQHLGKWIRKRKATHENVATNQLPNSTLDTSGIYSKSIIVDFFLKKRRFFYQLRKKC
ncbi:MAG: glycosyltransferase family 2 protein [Chitinophagales bacterium]